MKSESFLYDTRNRLTTTQVTGQSQKSVTYDQTGNILTKTDAGTYYYNTNNVNALASVTFLRSGITTEPQTIAYNSQNKVTEMSEGDYSYNVLYGAIRERIKSRLYENSVLSKTIYYSPGYEKITTAGGTVENHYIVSPFGLEAIITKTGTTENLYLAETDHLGSLIGLFDTSGVHVERYSYDAWGRRRNPSDWTFLNVPAPVITERGFTGHEHLDKFRLINMNGRLYDPVTGRFLNADPVIDNSGGAQGLNSYTYVLNNPLKYTDPSGYIKNAPPEPGVIVNPGWLRYAGYGHYSSTWFQQEFGAGSGGGGGGGMYGKPGQDGNGTGLGGIYYDNVSGTYRDVTTYHEVSQEVFINVIETHKDAYVTWLYYSGSVDNPYERLTGYGLSDGTNVDFIDNSNSDGEGKNMRGTIISVANGIAAAGPVGIMADVGGVIDSKGNSMLYLTVGWAVGFGASGGLGYSRTSKNFDLNSFAGYSEGKLVSLPIFGGERFKDYANGTDTEYRGLNYTGTGVNVGVGYFLGVYHAYTFMSPVPPPDFWCRPWRHF